MHTRSFAVILLIAIFTSQTFACWRPQDEEKRDPDDKEPIDQDDKDKDDESKCDDPCGVCEELINVTIIFRNDLLEPHFEKQITIENQPSRELIHFLEQAVEMDPTFKFSATYFKDLGYSIDSFNSVSGGSVNGTYMYWKIIEHATGNGLDLGASSYKPQHGETVLFDFIAWSPNSGH